MKPQQCNSQRQMKQDYGFALMATISILSLIVIITLAILSLSTITTCTASHGRHIQIAKANARVALAEAISRLQSTLGSDQSISANASILDSDPLTESIDDVAQPDLLGAWSSWSPNFKASPTQAAPNYKTEKTLLRLARFAPR